MKLKYLAIVASLGMVSSLQAITIQTGIGFSPGVIPQDSSGSVITTTYQFAVGVFATEPASTASFAEAFGSFREFTRATVAANATGGKITAPGNGAIPAVSTEATREFFDTKEAYVFVGNGATLEASTQFAVVKGTPTWTFPANTTGAASFNVILASADSFSAVVGTEINNATGVDGLQLVPEPSSAILGLLVGLGFMSRRTRKA